MTVDTTQSKLLGFVTMVVCVFSSHTAGTDFMSVSQTVTPTVVLGQTGHCFTKVL